MKVLRMFFGLLLLFVVGETCAATLRVGPGEAIRHIADAARLAKDGDLVEIIASDYVGDVALWTQKNLTLRGIGGRPRLVANGRAMEGKAIWVIRGGDVVVDNIAFSGARVPALNGAGIRHEGGRLTVRNCLFDDNEMGILTANRAELELVVENSEFAHGVRVTPRISHLLYAGRIGRLEVRGSYFHHSVIGHLLKSRAAFNLIEYNRLTDEAGGQASYELEFPEGGVAIVLGNLIQQSASTDNPRIVAYGAEGFTHPDNTLILASNTLVDERPYGGEFLHVWSPEYVAVHTLNNLLLGGSSAAGFAAADGNVFINMPAVVATLAAAGYRPAAGLLAPSSVDPDTAYGIALRPAGEYLHRAGWQRFTPARTLLVPGAFQPPASR